MARARNIKPGFFESEQVGTVSIQARLLFISLWQLADREGRLIDRPMQIKAFAFRYDAISADAVDGWLAELDTAGLISRYQIEGQKLIEIPTFVKHQRPHQREEQSVLPGRFEQKPCLGKAEHNLGTADQSYMALQPDLGTARHNLGLPKAPYMGTQPDLGTAEASYMGGQPALNPECGILNAESGMLKARREPLARPAATALLPFDDGPDAQQLVSDLVDEVAKFWPRVGNPAYAKSAWHRFAATDAHGAEAWCERIKRDAKMHADALSARLAEDPKTFVPTLERWVVDGDYKNPPTMPKRKPLPISGNRARCNHCGGEGFTLPDLDMNALDGIPEAKLEAHLISLRIPCPECAA